MFERYRGADITIQHVANIGHVVEPIMAMPTVTGEMPGGTTDAKI